MDKEYDKLEESNCIIEEKDRFKSLSEKNKIIEKVIIIFE